MKKLFPILLAFYLSKGLTGLSADLNHITVNPEGISGETVQQRVAMDGKAIRVDSFRLSIIPPSSGVQFYGDGIIFLSHSKDETRMLQEHVSFGTPQTSYGLFNDSAIIDQRLFIPSSPFPYPSEAITFNRDYTLMLYTMRTRSDPAEKIWMARYSGGESKRDRWLFETRPLDFCTGSSTYTHPALSADGNLLVFSSNMPGTAGEMDLFMTTREGDGWREPVNMGKYINSAGNELFPFLDTENNLWFSSDGRGGFGGYDIYMCRFDGKAWSYPVNLTQAVNTPDDDIAFTINRSDGRTAFYTTRESSRRRNMQLYRVSLDPLYITAGLKDLTDAFTATAVADRAMEKYITEALTSEISVIAAREELKSEPVIKVPETKPEQTDAVSRKEKAQPEDKIAEAIAGELKTEDKKTVPEPEKKAEPAAPKQPVQTATPAASKAASDGLIYRVQFSASMKPVGPFQVTVDDKNYTTYEYLYAGGYRSCAGEFNTLREATALQNAMRKAGFEQAFVVAFRNGERVVNFR